MVTLVDVAKDCNVSKSTVSLVINNSTAIREETRQRVLESIKKLGYVPNMAARELQTKRKKIIGMVFLVDHVLQNSVAFHSMPETLFFDTFTGISCQLKDTDYGLLSERFSARDSEELPSLIKNNRVDGVIIIGGLFKGDFIKKIQQKGIPAVLVGRHFPGIDSVAPDVSHAIYLSTKHLLENGHRHIVFINGPKQLQTSQEKLAGFRKAIQDDGENDCKTEVLFSGFAANGGYDAMKKLWNDGSRPDAILSGSDGIAVGAMRYLYEQKLRIPEDISVMGYERSIITEHAVPALSSAEINKEIMGMEACKLLLQRIEGKGSEVLHHTVDVSLVKRDSVKIINT